MPPKARLILNDPVATGVDPGQDYLGEAFAELNHKARRLAKKRVLKNRTETRQRVATESDIPPGSVLSDATIEMIKAGKFALAVDLVKGYGQTPRKEFRNPSAARRYKRRHPNEVVVV